MTRIDDAWYMSNKAGIPTAFEVMLKSIGQYTGMIDCNNKKIFEGDIVQRVEDCDDSFGCLTTNHFYSVVMWDKENFC